MNDPPLAQVIEIPAGSVLVNCPRCTERVYYVRINARQLRPVAPLADSRIEPVTAVAQWGIDHRKSCPKAPA